MSVRAEAFQGAAWRRISAPKTIGIVGIALGLTALWIALPPVKERSIGAPAALGVLAIAAGIFVFARGERKVGGGAVVSGLVGIGTALLVMQAATSRLSTVFVWSALIAATLRWATPLTFAALGGLFSENDPT